MPGFPQLSICKNFLLAMKVATDEIKKKRVLFSWFSFFFFSCLLEVTEFQLTCV